MTFRMPSGMFDVWIKDIAATLRDDDYILDIGGARPFQKYLAKYRGLLEGKLKTLDIDPNTHPDFVGDAHALPFEDSSVKAIISIATLEHLKDPFKAVSEMYRVLQSGGAVLVYVPFLHPYHGNERFSDYWRFTHEGITELFKRASFDGIEIAHNGTIVDIMKKSLPRKVRWLNYLLRPGLWVYQVISPYSKNITPGYFLYAVK